MGSHPSVVDWNNDAAPDLLVGDNVGYVYIFLNTGTNPDGTPILDSGARVQGDGADLVVSDRATAIYEDWDGDGYKDLLVGAISGDIGIYINNGSNAFNYSGKVTATGWAPVPYGYQSRSAPRVFDWDRDGLKDLLVGEVAGYIWFFKNVTTDPVTTPFVFSTAEKLLLSDDVTNVRYTLSGSSVPRSRIYIIDWNEDGLYDIISGGNDGKLQLFLGKNLISTVMPVPDNRQSWYYDSVELPVLSDNPSQPKPVGLGYVAIGGNTLSVQIGLNEFSGPIDIYGAYTVSADSLYVNVLNPNGTSFTSFTISDIMNALSTGVPPTGSQPWRTNVTEPINEDLFDMPVSSIPPDLYTVYLLTTPAGSLSSYYLWITSFVIQ